MARRRKSRKKAAPRRKTVKRAATKRKTTRRKARRNPSTAKRKAAAKKAARTRAANKRRRSLAAKRGAAKRKRTARKPARRKTRKYTANKKRVVRRKRYKKNAGDKALSVAKKVGAGFAGFLAGRITAKLMEGATFIPENMRPYMGLGGTAAALGLALYLPKKVKALRPYKTELVLGAGIALADVVMSSFAPASVRQYIGAPLPIPGGAMSSDLTVYEAALRGFGTPPAFLNESGDWGQKPMLPGKGYPIQAAMAEYVQEPLSEYIQEPMGEYVLGGLDAGVVSDGIFGGETTVEALDDDLPF